MYYQRKSIIHSVINYLEFYNIVMFISSEITRI